MVHQKMCNKIHSVYEYNHIVKKLIDSGHFTYRGQCYFLWPLEPGIIRRVKKTYAKMDRSDEMDGSGLSFRLSIDHTIELLQKSRTNGYFDKHECDLNILAVLQHYGAATPLLDFTLNPLVALYFACQPYLQDDIETDGKVFCINYPDQIRSHNSPMRPVIDPAIINIESDLNPSSHRGIWYWKTPHILPCRRSQKQESVFVFGWGLYWRYSTDRLINEMKTLIISAESKSGILNELRENHDISDQTLFPDIEELAKSNSHEKAICDFSAQDFYRKGEKEYQAGNFEWAAEYYQMAYTKEKDWVCARYKCALSLNWNGDQQDALKVVSDSIAKLGEKWEFLLCRACINLIIDNEWKSDVGKARKMAIDENRHGEYKSFVSTYFDDEEVVEFS